GAAFEKANEAFPIYRLKTPGQRADFLDKIGDEILALGDALIQRCMQETGLPEARLTGERGRTVNQLRLFAGVIREGSWVDARIDTEIPDRSPVPKPDMRRMNIALGPVGIFGASNFPLAFSVAGGDTASALAAGCPVVVKAHPAHPGTSELIGTAIANAAKKTGMPAGIFSLLHGLSYDIGLAMVRHPMAKAIGFTGSFAGGKALYDAAVSRPEPIPVYAEMGSSNPLFILPNALSQKSDALARGLAFSVTLGVGQFCTNPGLVFLVAHDNPEDVENLINNTAEALKAVPAGTMLTAGIKTNYHKGLEKLKAMQDVALEAKGEEPGASCCGTPHLFRTTAETFIKNPQLADEVFGPSTIMITVENKKQLADVVAVLKGHLTATLHVAKGDLDIYGDLTVWLENKVGRLIINGFPTGVEVCPSMHHGGPFPATTDSRSTSVGTAAITRFARPICYQGFPRDRLPAELKDENPMGISRIVNGERTQEAG
ncbi:MAG: aldehyde dehydrogenase (NADP(+)), partial [bacterium]|nr:aldehyde dehydrogenase (NADP(+)) [bacterium]